MRVSPAVVVAALLLAMSAPIAAADRRPSPSATFPGPPSGPLTTNNDDTCDIGVAPAATLLLPYFEVDLIADQSQARNTNFTITNVVPEPQIAKVTLWTDRAFPVLDFNLFLTGYDVQPISMYDIVMRGQIPPTSSTSARGSRSLSSNPNHLAGAAASCASLPGPIPASLAADVRNGLSTGTYGALTGVGNSHPGVAIGYLTIDVVATCSTTLPTDETYYSTELLFDNVLIGDYYQINSSFSNGNFITGNPMVHLRAIPEGGAAGSVATVNLPFTFYDRYTSPIARKQDRRQPLPSVYMARYVEGGPSGLATDLLVWREGLTSGTATQAGAVSPNGSIPSVEIVRFDDAENSTSIAPCTFEPCPPSGTTPATSRVATTNASLIPPRCSVTGKFGGWLYVNLSNGGSAVYSAGRTTSQNWVTSRLMGEGRYGSDVDAIAMENGCSAARARTPSLLSGDANGDARVSVADIFYLINHLFAGGPGPIGLADANCDARTSVADIFYLINFLFANGPQPVNR